MATKVTMGWLKQLYNDVAELTENKLTFLRNCIPSETKSGDWQHFAPETNFLMNLRRSYVVSYHCI